MFYKMIFSQKIFLLSAILFAFTMSGDTGKVKTVEKTLNLQDGDFVTEELSSISDELINIGDHYVIKEVWPPKIDLIEGIKLNQKVHFEETEGSNELEFNYPRRDFFNREVVWRVNNKFQIEIARFKDGLF